MKIELIEVKDAYRKLKSYVYYDNYFIYLREKLSDFEASTDFPEKLNRLQKFLSNEQTENELSYLQNLLGQISSITVPKRYKEDEITDDSIISNRFTKKHYEIESVNHLIDAPIEIHIISVLWILREGKYLTEEYKKSNYAYELEIDNTTNEVVDGLRLFKPYFEQYQKWRDNAIDKAQHFAEEETDVLMIGLDVKKYFYNIDLQESGQKILHAISTAKIVDISELELTRLLMKIHGAYQSVLPKNKDLTQSKIIPIGLLSSGIIGNWFLHKLDQDIIQNLSPAYYGRYVDDIVIVLANASIPIEVEKPKEWVLEKFFTDRKILSKKPEKQKGEKTTNYSYCWVDNENIILQKDKISIYAFDSKESSAMLNKFKKNIERNSSAFWFLPESEGVNDDFDENVYELTYSDTVNKLRSINGIKQSKYGASIFLAKKIKLSILSQGDKDPKTAEQILDFLKGRMNLEFNSIWEKALTYFVINNLKDELWRFVKETLFAIESLLFSSNDYDLSEIKRNQVKFLENCLALAISFNPHFLNESNQEDLEKMGLKYFSASRVKSTALKFRSTNMLRHYFIVHPLLNFCVTSDKLNFLKFNLGNYTNNILSDKKFEFSPRYIYFHEFVHFNTFKELAKQAERATSKENVLEVANLFLKPTQKDSTQYENHILNESFDKYYYANYTARNSLLRQLLNYKTDKDRRNALYQKYVFTHQSNNTEDIIHDSIEIGADMKPKSKIRVALANTIVENEHIKASMLAEPILTSKRRDQFIDILNQAEKCKADILVLPEVSIPYFWLPVLADESRRKQRVIIGGLEHIRINDVCYNLMLKCIPIERNGIKDVVTILRLKNHYSPAETKLIQDKGKIVPRANPPTYNKIIWRKNHFSVYNCYELADIKHRSIFRSEVDMLFASEYNHDVNYFSNITDTISRDIHCFFIQVNTSDFGDSRITKPSKTEAKDLMRLKGGKNSVVLYEELDLNDLREFQSTRLSGQDTSKYKNTPPNYIHKSAESRLKEE